jgi:hypothetical protein
MSKQCAFEQQVVEAARTQSSLSGELQAHADACPVCAEVLWLTAALATTEQVPVPPAGLIYWKAEIAARRDRADAALRPARWMQAASLAALFVLMAVAAIVSGSAWLIGAAVVAVVATLAAVAWIVRSA